MLQRTLSLGRGDRSERPQGGLLRRLSGKGRPPTREFNMDRVPPERRMSMDSALPQAGAGDSYFPPQAEADFRPGPFLRRPTNLSLKSTKKASKRVDDGMGAFVNLEGGLAVTLNLELNSKDPSGITTPYKLLIPALWYEGTEYDPPAAPVTKGWRKWLGVRRNASSKPSLDEDRDGDRDAEEDEEEYSDEDEPVAPAPQERAPPGRPVTTGRPVSTPAPQRLSYEYDDDEDEDDSELFLGPEPEARPNVKRSSSIKKWFGRS